MQPETPPSGGDATGHTDAWAADADYIAGHHATWTTALLT
jgi:hypothetical protein